MNFTEAKHGFRDISSDTRRWDERKFVQCGSAGSSMKF